MFFFKVGMFFLNLVFRNFFLLTYRLLMVSDQNEMISLVR